MKLPSFSKGFARLHSPQAGMVWYQLSLFALSLYGAWSVSVAIDMYYQTANWIDKGGLQLFAWLVLLSFGSYLMTQWASLMHALGEASPANTGNSRQKQGWNWGMIGIGTGVGLMLVTEAASRASVFLRRWPDVSVAEIIFAIALTLYFCIPIFLGPAMAHQARRIRQDADSEAKEAVTNSVKGQLVKALTHRVEQMSDDELLQKYGHLLPEVTGSLALPSPKSAALPEYQASQQSVNQNGRTSSPR
jgi:hypothetical protein